MPIQKTCERCGSSYTVIPSRDNKSRFCGRLCHNAANGEAQRTRVTKACEQCGKEYTKTYCLAPQSRFCSRACRAAAWIKIVAKTCERCGGAYEIGRTRVQGSRFCSRACRFEGTAVVKACERCGEAYKVKSSYAPRSRFCSLPCKYGWSEQETAPTKKSRRREREKNAPIVEKIDRQAIIERDGRRCYLWCGGAIVAKGQITLDHVLPLARGGTTTARNLRVACLSCNSRKCDKLLSELTDLPPYTFSQVPL